MDPKFFQESNGYQDARFYKAPIASPERLPQLVKLLAALCAICEKAQVKPILMHGALIGWYWNRRLLPWDVDVDVSLFYDDLVQLDEFVRRYPEVCSTSDILLEINPSYTNRTTLNQSSIDNFELNKIDARCIAKASGLYVDITALCPEEGDKLRTKCPHVFRLEDVLPLTSATLEDISVYVPAKVENVLTQEYGPGVLTNIRFNNHRFELTTRCWVVHDSVPPTEQIAP